jgi:hypothetical protein
MSSLFIQRWFSKLYALKTTSIGRLAQVKSKRLSAFGNALGSPLAQIKLISTGI